MSRLRPATMTKRSIPLAAKIGIIFTILALISAVITAREGRRMLRNFEAWQTAEPVRLNVDLSAPGEYRARFHQTCAMSHGEAIDLLVSPAFESPETACTSLAGMEATVSITDPSGKEVLSEPLTPPAPDAVSQSQSDGRLSLAYFHPSAVGEYDFAVRITRPAANIKGRRQELSARYLLCGCECMPAKLGFLISGIALLAGGIAGILSYASIRRTTDKRTTDPTTDQ